MIHCETKLRVGDNSGAKITKCIQILNKKNYNVGHIGSLILVRVLKKSHSKKIKKKIIYFGLIIMLKQYNIRKEGIILKFVENRVLLFSNAHKFIGTRIYSPIMKEIKTSFRINKKDQQKYYKIFSYSIINKFKCLFLITYNKQKYYKGDLYN